MQINSGMMPGKWNLARFLNEDEALIKGGSSRRV
jgi:hypothetical protein